MLSQILSSNLGGAALSCSFLHRRVRPPDSDRPIPIWVWKPQQLEFQKWSIDHGPLWAGRRTAPLVLYRQGQPDRHGLWMGRTEPLIHALRCLSQVVGRYGASKMVYQLHYESLVDGSLLDDDNTLADYFGPNLPIETVKGLLWQEFEEEFGKEVGPGAIATTKSVNSWRTINDILYNSS